ncbi:nadE [Symbiodinium microadriaticum]|nr:nadE [Symbiodinium microadriaticum]
MEDSMKTPVVKAGIGIIVIKDGKILTGIRKGSHGEGRRAFPGGHIDPEDESLVHASLRELKEECGIGVSHRLIRGGWDLFTTFDILSDDGQKRYVTIYMLADYVDGGDWIDENTLRGQEPEKCERWELHTLSELTTLVEAEGDTENMNGKFIFGGNIPPFMMPFMEQQDPRRSPADDAFVPPRVNKALEFLELLAMMRQRKVPAATDHQVEIVEQDPLAPEEEATQTAALQCLANYFDGKLQHNVWEELRFKSLQNQEAVERQSRAMPPQQGPEVTMTRLMSCPACAGKSEEETAACDMCDGEGQLIFEPAKMSGEDAMSIVQNMPGPLGQIFSQIIQTAQENGINPDGSVNENDDSDDDEEEEPLTSQVREVLLVNACDMADNGNEEQRIKGRNYEGVITSNLESVPYVGLSIVIFKADIVCPDIGPAKVSYGVRTQDLNGDILSRGKWSNSIEEMLEECGLLTKKNPAVSVGDPKANTDETLQILGQHLDSDIVVFPELGLTGYTCGDLFRQDMLYYSLFDQFRRLCEYSAANPQQLIFVGAPFRLDNELFNCAVAINDGKLKGIVPKQNIPNYNEFYEGRWFRAADGNELTHVTFDEQWVAFGIDLIFGFRDVKVMAEVCEDLWMPIPPSSHAALAGAQIAVNLSASNETVAKCEYRRDLVSQQSGRCMSAYVYSSAGPTESTSDLVFGGHCLIAENSRILIESSRVGDGPNIRRGNTFITTDVDVQRLQAERRLTTSFGDASRHATMKYRTVRINLQLEEEAKPLIQKRSGTPFVPQNEDTLHNRCAEIFGIQVAGLAKRIERLGPNPSLNIGVSGGLDSTLALLVAEKACRLLRLPSTTIKAVTMPGFGTTNKTKTNALNLMEYLGVESTTIDIRPACLQTFKDIRHDPFEMDLFDPEVVQDTFDVEMFEETLQNLPDENLAKGDLTFENVQARQRTYLLMSRGFVLGTGDLSELALGWCTYNGDHMSMYNVNASIPKTLVQFLVRHVAENEYPVGPVRETLLDIAGTVISPELLPHQDDEIVQSTEDVLGPYELHDFYLFYMMRHGFAPKKIWYLAQNAQFTENYSDELKLKTLRTFITRFFSQQFKRNCVPDGPKVGSVSLSPRGDWRMPSDAEATAWIAQLDEIDYALHDYGVVAVSDGCSNGNGPSIDTDWGSRIIAHLGMQYLPILMAGDTQYQESNFIQRVISHAVAVCNTLSKHTDCLTASLLMAFEKGDFINTLRVGDGIVGAKYRDGSIRFSILDFNMNAPFYPIYAESPQDLEGFFDKFGSKVKQKTYSVEEDTDEGWDNIEESSVEFDYSRYPYLTQNFKKEEVEFVFIGSDGCEQFLEQVQHATSKYSEPVALPKVVRGLIDFGHFNHNFVRHQCHWMLKLDKPNTFVRLGWEPMFGGGFDPISLHHQFVVGAISVLDYDVWFMPCFQHQYGKELVEAKHRLRMCELVTRKVANWYTSDFEIKNELTGFFYENLLHLKEAFPQFRFHPIIGTDNANDIGNGKWGRGEELIAENSMIVVERGEHPLEAFWCLQGDHKFFSLGTKGAATDVRKAIKEGRIVPMKKFTIEGTGKEVRLGDSNYKTSGGEGDIYIEGDTVYKVCFDGAMIPRQKFNELRMLDHPKIVKPEDIILKGKKEVGYTMRLVPGGAQPLASILTKQYREREGVTPDQMMKLVQQLRNGFQYVHDKGGFLIVDGNEFNFMVTSDHEKLYFIDVPSYQTPSFPATAIMNSVRDWSVGKDGRGEWEWSELSDWYSFGILSWYMFTGIHPFKGRIPSFKVPLDQMMVECMKNNRSVLDPDSMFPEGAVYFPFEDYIPGGKSGPYWQWFEAMFVRGERLPAPADFSAQLIVVKVKEITGLDKFIMQELFKADKRIRGYYESKGREVVVSEDTCYVDGIPHPLPAERFRVGFSPVNNIAVAVYLDGNEVRLRDIAGQKDIRFDCRGKDIVSAKGRLFIRGNRDMLEVKLFEKKGEIYMAQPESVFSVMEQATEVYQGCVLMRTLGQYMVGVLPEGRTVKIKELDDYRITEMKYESNVLMAIGLNRKTNQYDRLVFRFDADHNSYDVRVIDSITPVGINFTVLDNDRCISITEEEKVEISIARKDDGRMTVIDDPEIVADMRLCHASDRVQFARGDKLFSISVKS